LTAFYSDSQGNWYSSTFFNQTVNIVEVNKLVDWELLFLILLFAGALGFGGRKAFCFRCHELVQPATTRVLLQQQQGLLIETCSNRYKGMPKRHDGHAIG
jgi:hypothetical protein